LSRLLSTGSLKAVEQTVALLRNVIDRDYTGVIKRKLDEVYRTGSSASNIRGEKADRENRFTFMVGDLLPPHELIDHVSYIQILLNDLDVSSSHLESLTRDLLRFPAISQHFLEVEQPAVKNAVSSLSALITRFRSTLRVNDTFVLISVD
jgi:conserved oligomeric Golgi complex subunit 4